MNAPRQAGCDAARVKVAPHLPWELRTDHEHLMMLRRLRPDVWGFVTRTEIRRAKREEKRERNRRAHEAKREAEWRAAAVRRRLNQPAPMGTAPDATRP